MLHVCWDITFVLASARDFIIRLFRFTFQHMQPAIALLVGPSSKYRVIQKDGRN